ncbi:MAG: hypothetical protein QOG51_1706 [Verrucomicrobiota bacterium]|jgi:hypothetical protein
MKRHFSDGRSIAIMAAGFISLFLFTLVLSAIPQLHERIHSSSGATNHECAVTLLTSGNYQHSGSDTIAIAPPPATAFAHVFSRFELVRPRLEFSLLEHAPPAIS